MNIYRKYNGKRANDGFTFCNNRRFAIRFYDFYTWSKTKRGRK